MPPTTCAIDCASVRHHKLCRLPKCKVPSRKERANFAVQKYGYLWTLTHTQRLHPRRKARDERDRTVFELFLSGPVVDHAVFISRQSCIRQMYSFFFFFFFFPFDELVVHSRDFSICMSHRYCSSHKQHIRHVRTMSIASSANGRRKQTNNHSPINVDDSAARPHKILQVIFYEDVLCFY